MSERVVRRVIIRGSVQGVGFRAFVEHMALMRDLEGWVRNRRDGSVEAVFAGPAEAVATMIEACRTGPYGARVEALDELPAESDDLKLLRPAERFSVLPSA